MSGSQLWILPLTCHHRLGSGRWGRHRRGEPHWRRQGEEALHLATLAGRGATPETDHHRLGNVYLAQGDLEHAILVWEHGLALAEELGMRPLMAHCHLGLGRLYGQTGRDEPARVALPTATDLYRAMDMTFWLPQAEAALAQGEDYHDL
jgi:hypothetical protein